MVGEDGCRSRREATRKEANEGHDRPQAHKSRAGDGFDWEQRVGCGNKGAFNAMEALFDLTELVYAAQVGVQAECRVTRRNLAFCEIARM